MNRAIFFVVFYMLSTGYCSAQNSEFTFIDDEAQNYRYTVVQAGDNYNFKFDTAPLENTTKLKAGYHVLQSIYKG